MSKDWYQDIVDFHHALNQVVNTQPTEPGGPVTLLRIKLIEEETRETVSALLEGDIVEIADGIADSIVVLLGTAVSYGIDIRPIWDEIHRTNLAKQGGPTRADGKSLKPDGWQAPRVRGLLLEQGME